MESLKKLMFKPRVDDWSPLAKFYHADESLNSVAAELDALDGKREPERCNQLVNRLRHCQDRVLQTINEILSTVFPNEEERAPRDYRVKFPDDILHDNLPGQLWFGAECLAAGSNIIDHEFESEAIRPLAKCLTRHLDQLRESLKDQSLRNTYVYPDKLKRSLRSFDYLFAEFELNYVSAMVPVKSVREYDAQLDVAVLFSETLIRSLKLGYVKQEQLDDCDPIVMVTLPRLAIVCGLLTYPDGPLRLDRPTDELPDVFKLFHALLKKIRNLLRVLTDEELTTLELCLCNNEEPKQLLMNNNANVTLVSEYHKMQKGDQRAPIAEAEIDVSDTTETQSSTIVFTSVPSEQTDQSPAGGDFGDPEAATELLATSPPSDAVEDGPQLEENTASGEEQLDSEEAHSSSAQMSPEALRLRCRFKSAEDLLHRLFVCVAGVADQMQVNNPSDLRAILKLVLQPQDTISVFEVSGQTARSPGNEEELGTDAAAQSASNQTTPVRTTTNISSVRLPVSAETVLVGADERRQHWVPDSECRVCAACELPFTLVRRRHHCRHCGRIFCARCTTNCAPLPQLGYMKKVRVCNQCFVYRINPFTPEEQPEAEGPSGQPETVDDVATRDDDDVIHDDTDTRASATRAPPTGIVDTRNRLPETD